MSQIQKCYTTVLKTVDTRIGRYYKPTTTVKRLVVDLLRAICKQTTNTLDDRAVDILEKQLFPN